MNPGIRYWILAGFTVAIVKCGAQQQIQPDREAVKATSEVIQVQPLTGGSNASKITTNQLFLKSINGLMSYDARISSTNGIAPLSSDYGVTDSAKRIDARHWRLGIEQAERINLMQMNEYRWRNTAIPNSSTPETFYPAATERMFNAK